MTLDVGTPRRHAAAVFIRIAADEMNGQASHLTLRGDLLPGIPRHLHRVDAVGDHVKPDSKVVRGDTVRDDVPFCAKRGREASPQLSLLDRVDPDVSSGQAMGQEASDRGLARAGQA